MQDQRKPRIFLHRAVQLSAAALFAIIEISAYPSAATAADKQDGVRTVVTLVSETLIKMWESFVTRIPHIAAAVLLLILTWLASKLASRILVRILKKTTIRTSLRDLADRFIVIGVWVVGILLAAMIVFPDLTPSKALGAMGIASIAVGFAFKDIFENFFAGVLILWRFPLENGDFIECQDITGKVEKVSVRTTEIRLTTGELVVMPNSILFKNPVEIITNRKKRRLTIISGVAYGEDITQAVDVIEKALENCKSIDRQKGVQVFPHAFGASSIDIEISWWTESAPLAARRSKGEIITAVKQALDDAGIEIPFPYRTLTFKAPLEIEHTGQ